MKRSLLLFLVLMISGVSAAQPPLTKARKAYKRGELEKAYHHLNEGELKAKNGDVKRALELRTRICTDLFFANREKNSTYRVQALLAASQLMQVENEEMQAHAEVVLRKLSITIYEDILPHYAEYLELPERREEVFLSDFDDLTLWCIRYLPKRAGTINSQELYNIGSFLYNEGMKSTMLEDPWIHPEEVAQKSERSNILVNAGKAFIEEACEMDDKHCISLNAVVDTYLVKEDELYNRVLSQASPEK